MDILVTWRQYKGENSASKFDSVRSNVSNRQLCAQILARRGEVWPHFSCSQCMVKPAECLETKKFLKIYLYAADIRVRKSSQKPTIPGHHELTRAGAFAANSLSLFMHFLDELSLLSVVTDNLSVK